MGAFLRVIRLPSVTRILVKPSKFAVANQRTEAYKGRKGLFIHLSEVPSMGNL